MMSTVLKMLDGRSVILANDAVTYVSGWNAYQTLNYGHLIVNPTSIQYHNEIKLIVV